MYICVCIHTYEGLPARTYCNIIDDCKTLFRVGADGMTLVHFDDHYDPILAAYIGCDGNSFSIGKSSSTSKLGDCRVIE